MLDTHASSRTSESRDLRRARVSTAKFLPYALLALAAACATAPRARDDIVRGVATTSDGVAIAYDVRGAGEPTLVFAHCWCGDREFWREQLDEFARERRVVALDLSGHGASGAHAQPSLEALAGDIVVAAAASSVTSAASSARRQGDSSQRSMSCARRTVSMPELIPEDYTAQRPVGCATDAPSGAAGDAPRLFAQRKDTEVPPLACAV